jgi:hypothetical protein
VFSGNLPFGGACIIVVAFFDHMPDSHNADDKAPLWQKLYSRPQYTDVARMIGYAGLDLPEAQQKAQELITKYGKEKVKQASDDLLQFSESFVRLTTEARKLCWQLLGPPPEYTPIDMYAEIMASGERLKGLKPRENPKAKKARKKKTPTPLSDAPVPVPARASIPIMEQYREAKERHPGMLLLFRRGDFYELFEQDAETAAKVLGLTLTSRDNTMSMAGFPHHSLEGYLHKLLKDGHRVAICEPVDERPPCAP